MSTNATVPRGTRHAKGADVDLVGMPSLLHPWVDRVASVRATVHTKLLAGFLVIAVLLLAMGVLSIGVLARINDQVDTLTSLSEQTNQARQMIYEVTAQSHYRAMELLTGRSVVRGQDRRREGRRSTRSSPTSDPMRSPRAAAFFDELASDRRGLRRLERARDRSCTRTGSERQALQLHITEEHAISHELEDSLNAADRRLAARWWPRRPRRSRAIRRFLTIAVASFSGRQPARRAGARRGPVVVADPPGAPGRRRARAHRRRRLRHAGRRAQPRRVRQPHQEPQPHERAARRPSTGTSRSLNANLQETVDAKVRRARASLAPEAVPVAAGLAESIIAGERDVTLAPRRKFLTTFFSDVRGFTAGVRAHGARGARRRAERLPRRR